MQKHTLLHTSQSSTHNTCIPNCLVCRSICSCIPDSHPQRITSTKCCINTVVFPDDGPTVARNMQRLININILRINCAPSWFYLQDNIPICRGGRHLYILQCVLLEQFCDKQLVKYARCKQQWDEQQELVLNLITVQQDATYSVYYISVSSSTCFGC